MHHMLFRPLPSTPPFYPRKIQYSSPPFKVSASSHVSRSSSPANNEFEPYTAIMGDHPITVSIPSSALLFDTESYGSSPHSFAMSLASPTAKSYAYGSSDRLTDASDSGCSEESIEIVVSSPVDSGLPTPPDVSNCLQ